LVFKEYTRTEKALSQNPTDWCFISEEKLSGKSLLKADIFNTFRANHDHEKF
jgi:hypothetical protein